MIILFERKGVDGAPKEGADLAIIQKNVERMY